MLETDRNSVITSIVVSCKGAKTHIDWLGGSSRRLNCDEQLEQQKKGELCGINCPPICPYDSDIEIE